MSMKAEELTMTESSSIQQMFKQVEAAGVPFLTGDAAPIIALWSQADDVTIFGGSGTYAQGWHAVKSRLEWAAAHFRGGRGTLEPLAMGESGELAYTIYIERGEMQVEGSEELRPFDCVSHKFIALKMMTGRSSTGTPIPSCNKLNQLGLNRDHEYLQCDQSSAFFLSEGRYWQAEGANAAAMTKRRQ